MSQTGLGEPLLIVATLTVRATEKQAFEAFETEAAAVMARHGGRMERAIRTRSEDDIFREVHIVRFPDLDSFEAYRADPRLTDLLPLRVRSVVSAELLQGREGPDYGDRDH